MTVGLGVDAPGSLRDVKRFSHEAMATVFGVHVLHPDATYAAQAAHAAFDLVDRLESELTRFLPNSDIGRINALRAGGGTQVSPSTMECLVIARHMYDLTGGAFDVSVGTGFVSIELDPAAFRVRATKADVRIDLGGIGKGYAVDLMAEVLEEWGLESALVHGGFSSLITLGTPDDVDGWPLTLSDPASPSRVLVRMAGRQMALGASGVRKGDHIVDPRTGKPAAGRRAVWVSAPRARGREAGVPGGFRLAAGAVTDALATAFMLMRPREIGALCAKSPGLEAWVLPAQAGRGSEAPGVLHFGSPGTAPGQGAAG